MGELLQWPGRRWHVGPAFRYDQRVRLEAAAIGVVVSVDLILADWRHTAGSCSGELSLL
jgi:hypothetical protein